MSRRLSISCGRALRAPIASLWILFLLVCGATAQPSFWQRPTSGPGGGHVTDLVRQPYGYLFAVMAGGPVYRSDNDGWTWEPLRFSATRLAALPNGDLYSLGDRLDRSRDDGKTWTRLPAPPGANALVSAPSGRLLLGTQTGVFRSDDGGASWQSSGLSGANARVSALAFGPDGALYAGAGADFERSTDYGEQWSRVLTFPNQQITALAPRPEGGWWIGTYKTVYEPTPSGLFSYDGIGPPILVFNAEIVSAITVSTDGRTFVGTPGSYLYEGPGDVFRSPTGGRLDWQGTDLYQSVTALVPGPDGEVLAATAGHPGHLMGYPAAGIWALQRGAREWTQRSRGLAHATSVALASAPGIVFAQEDYSLAWSIDHGVTWYTSTQIPLDLYGLVLAADRSGAVYGTSIPYVVSTGARDVPRSASFTGFVRSLDRGATWTDLQAPPSYNRSIVGTAAGSVLMPADYSGGVVRSTDHGDSWAVVNNGAPSLPFVVLEAGPRSRVFGATDDGTYYSPDDGLHWVQIAAVGGGPMAVTSDEKSVYLVGPGGVRKLEETTSGSWSATVLPDLADIDWIAVDAKNTLYAATNSVWRLPACDHPLWQEIPDSAPIGVPRLFGGAPKARTMLFDDSGYLYVGTGGRSVLRSSLPLRDPTDVPFAGGAIAAWQPGPTPFRRDTAFRLELGRPERVSLLLFDVRGRVVSRLWDGAPLGAGAHVVSWQPAARLPSGGYFYRLTVANNTRSGRVTLIR